MAEADAPKNKGMERVKGMDLYLLLEVEVEADVKTIKKAYRQKAKTCHPDKNPDDKKAVELFHQLSDALEVLTDEATRRAYDNVLKARKAQELRVRAMDGKRQKLKEKLDRGERRHEDELWNRAEDENALAREIDRLRKEGSRQLAEEQELLRKQLAEELLGRGRQAEERQQARVKVRWDRKSTAWPYDRDSLERIFSKYGDVAAVVVNTKKGGSALVEFTSLNDARMAANIETGFPSNPLSVKPLWEEKIPMPAAAPASLGEVIDLTGPQGSEGVLSTDFESMVMRRLRQEQERKQLIAQMMAEDAS